MPKPLTPKEVLAKLEVGKSFKGLEIGPINFSGRIFEKTPNFLGSVFTGSAIFEGAKFLNGANFSKVKFCGGVEFHRAEFSGECEADFSEALFPGKVRAEFNKAQFSGEGGAHFFGVNFSSEAVAVFAYAKFSGNGGAYFGAFKFSCITFFDSVEFSCKKGAFYDGACFSGGRISIAQTSLARVGSTLMR